jgi:hypothetical protein
MDKNVHSPRGLEMAPPSLVARGSQAEAAEEDFGILGVVGQDHRPLARAPRPWMALAGVALAGLVIGGVWWAGAAALAVHPVQVGAPGALAEEASVLEAPSAGTAEQKSTETILDVDAARGVTFHEPQVARIEAAQPVTAVAAPAEERPVAVAAPSTTPSTPPSSSRQVTQSKRTASSPAREAGREPVRTTARRAPDPDADVIEVLMSRAVVSAARPAAGGQAGRSAPVSQDVVFVQPGVSTEELLKRCAALGGLEAQLCQTRICEARGGRLAACAERSGASTLP